MEVRNQREDAMVLVAPTIFACVSLAYAGLVRLVAPEAPILAYVNLGATATWAALAVTARRGRIGTVRWIMFPVVVLQIASQVWLYGPAPLTHLFLMTGLPASFLIFPATERRRMALLVAGVVAAIAALELGATPRITLSDSAVRTIRLMNLAAILLLVVSLGLYARRAVTHAEDALAREHARSERLLTNILPASIAARLKDDSGSIAERLDSATILFADLVGFTPLAQRMSPAELVAMLDKVFREFDALADAHGVEKIKTIGDAYMAAAGVPEPCDDHAHRVARMALAMQATLATNLGATFPELALRIGIASGPVVAGVIGERKFSYDLWGDTVNTASRMESHGVPARIQVSGSARELLGDAFRFEPRGTIDVKGKGPMEVHLLIGLADPGEPTKAGS